MKSTSCPTEIIEPVVLLLQADANGRQTSPRICAEQFATYRLEPAIKAAMYKDYLANGGRLRGLQLATAAIEALD